MIYEPKGKAREYSPLAVNLYEGCGHKCTYCYVPRTLHLDRHDFDNRVAAKKDALEKLAKDAYKYSFTTKQVLMSFSTDPYNPLNDELQLTREALNIFLALKIPVAILTKSGFRACQDMSLIKEFGKHIKVGASLTYDNDEESKRVEAGAATPKERILSLRHFKENGVRTWVSMEPIIHPEQTLQLIEMSLDDVDEYQLGKMSGTKEYDNYDWDNFLKRAVTMLRTNGKAFYIKETLAAEARTVKLEPEEIEMDFLNVPPFEIM